MTDSASAGAIRASIDFDAAGLERAVNKAMKRATGQIEDAIDRSMDDVQDTMRSGFRRVGAGILGFLGLEDVASGLRNVGAWVLQLGRDTESALNNFRAVSSATEAQMKAVSEVANQLGNDISLPGTSAADAALAMTELAKAGFTVEESMAAAKGTLQLATAAQIDAGRAAEISSKQLQAFGLGVDKAGFVADVLANAAAETSADMEGMADSLNQVGAVANASGIDITETAAAVALMADNAIVGSDAGTSLKSMLLALQAPSGKAQELMDKYGISVYDSAGNMKSLTEITAVLTEATSGLTDKERQFALATIFGADAIRAVNVLMNQGEDGMTAMTERLSESGAAAKLAAANSQGLVGVLNALQSSAESVAISVYQKVAPAISEWLRGGLERLPGVLDDAATYLDSLAEGLAPAAELIATFSAAASPGVVLAFKAALAAVLGVVRALGLVLEPLVALIETNEGAFRDIVGAIVAATVAYKVMTAAVNKAQAVYTSPRWNTAVGNVKKLSGTMRSASGIAAGFSRAAKGALGAVGGPWGLAIGAAAVAVGIFGQRQAEAEAHVQELTDSLDAQSGAITKNTRDLAIKALEDKGILKTAEELGVSLGLVTRAALGEADALEILRDGLGEAEEAHRLMAGVRGTSSAAQTEQLKGYSELVGAVEDEANALDGATAAARRKAIADREARRASKEMVDATITAEAGWRRGAGTVDEYGRQVMVTGDSLNAQARAAQGAKRAIESLNDEYLKGLGAQIGYEQAADDLRATIKKLTPEQIKSGRALDIQFQAGRDVFGAFMDLVNASGEVKNGMARAREQIYNTIRPMVDSKAEARRLTNQFFDLKGAADAVPNRVDIKVSANIGQAVSALTSVIPLANSVGAAIGAATSAVPRKRRAGGGPIYGYGTGVSDDVPALLSAGEHVFRAKEVQAAGGHDGIFAIRAALTRGGLPAVAEVAGGGGALVDNLSIAVGTKEDLPEALGETMFHLRRIKRGSRYLN